MIGFNNGFGWLYRNCKGSILLPPLVSFIRQWLTPSTDGNTIPDKRSVVSPTPNISRRVLTFDTPNDIDEYVNMNTLASVGDWEYSAIIYPTSNDNYQVIFGEDSTLHHHHYLRLFTETNALGMRFDGVNFTASDGNTAPLNEWSRVISKRVSNVLTIEAYELDGTLRFSENVGSISDDLSGELYFGWSDVIGRSFKGKCAQIVVNGDTYNCEEISGDNIYCSTPQSSAGTIIAVDTSPIRRGTIETFSDSYLYEPTKINDDLINLFVGVWFESTITSSSPVDVICGISDIDHIFLATGSSISAGSSETIRFGDETDGVYIRDQITSGYHRIGISYNFDHDRYYISVDGEFKTSYVYGSPTKILNHKLSVGHSASSGTYYPIKISTLSINSERYIDGGTILNSKLHINGDVTSYLSSSTDVASLNLLNGCSVVSNITPNDVLTNGSYWDYDTDYWSFDSSGATAVTSGTASGIDHYISTKLLVKDAYYRMTVSFNGTGDNLFISIGSFSRVGIPLGSNATDKIMDFMCVDPTYPFRFVGSNWNGIITKLTLERLDVATPLFTEPTKSIASFNGVDNSIEPTIRLPLNGDFNIETTVTSNTDLTNYTSIIAQYISGDVGRFVIVSSNTKIILFIDGSEQIEYPITTGVEYNIKASRTGDVFELIIDDTSIGTYTYSGDLADTDITIGQFGGSSTSYFKGDIKNISVDGLFDYDFTDYIGSITRNIIDLSGNDNHGFINGDILSVWSDRILDEDGIITCADYYPVNKFGGYINNGCGVLNVQDHYATELLDKVVVNGIDVMYGEDFGEKPSYGSPKSVFWEDDSWKVIIGGTTIIHPTASGQYPSTKDWPDNVGVPTELNYEMFGIEDDGKLSQLSMSDYLNFINGTKNTIIKWDIPVDGVCCHISEVVRYNQNTTKQWELSDLVDAITWANNPSCGSGFPSVVTYNGVYVTHNENIVINI